MRVILPLLLMLCVTCERAPQPVKPAIDAVWPLVDKDGQTFCTAFSINAQAGYFMTARHCAQAERMSHATLQGRWTFVTYEDPVMDLAVIQSPVHVPALRIAKREPYVGEPVKAVGYPYGLVDGRTATFGFMSALLVPMHDVVPAPVDEGPAHAHAPSTIVQLAAANSSSGSPILNIDGQLVGVLWGVSNETPLATCVPFDAVRRVMRVYASQ